MKYICMVGLLMIFALGGCGESPNASRPPTPPVAAPPVGSSNPASPSPAISPASVPAEDAVMDEMQDRLIHLTEQIKPVVVNIDTEGTVQTSEDQQRNFNELFKFFGLPFGQGGPQIQTPQEIRMALGSGFVYDKQGHVVTNNHMVEGASTIKVKLASGKEYSAKLVGRDPATDLAVIKIEPEGDLPAATLGDSDKLKVGQYAIACGSPRGFEGSFTFGHVSALKRNELNLPGLRFENFIQTDAAINPGNSGGPLCDNKGKVIGINVAIVAGANALGFAIPVNTAKQIIPMLIAKGKVTRGFLGVGVTDAEPFAAAMGLPDKKGAFVKTVQPGGPADKAGIKPYDVIRKVNGTEVDNAATLVQDVSRANPGETVKLEVWRDKKTQEIEVKIGEYPETPGQVTPAKESLGLHVDNLTPDIIAQLQLEPNTTGVLITSVDAMSPAGDAGLATGDVITDIAQQKVSNVDDFSRLLKENGGAGKSVLVGFIRNGQHDITVIKIPK